MTTDEKRKRGRPDNGFILKLVKLAFKDEAEYKRFLEMSTSRSRVEAVLNQAKIMSNQNILPQSALPDLTLSRIEK